MSSSSPVPPRVFVLSDIHTDYPENMRWVESLSDEAFVNDAVILAGDVSDQLSVLETTLRLFSGKFAHVFFTPGRRRATSPHQNHSFIKSPLQPLHLLSI